MNKILKIQKQLENINIYDVWQVNIQHIECQVVFQKTKSFYFPIQKPEKIISKISSVKTSPVISPIVSAALRKSIAISS